MRQTCKVENHSQKPLSFICTNPECQHNRLICFRCLEHGHKECLGFILEIEDIYKRNLPGNLNWLQNEEVKQALLLVQKHKESVPKGEVFGSIEEIVDREFNRVLIHFSGKVLEVKEKVLDDVKKRLFSEDVSLKDFEDQLKRLYNFDAVLGILDYFQIGEKDLNAITKELSIFFSETDLKDVQSNELSYIANKVSNLTQSLLDMNESLFTKLKNSVPMDIFKACIGNNLAVVENSTWTWDPMNKSEEIELSEDNTIAIKTAYYSGSKRAVIGNRHLSNDHFIWAIDLAGSTPHRPCFVNFAGYNTVLGIVESHLIHDVENPSLTNIIGFSLSGKMHNMDEVSKILDYRERTYVFDLDLVNGTFKVLTDGEVVLCEKTMDIKGKTFLPVVLLYCVHDKISLIVKCWN